MSLESDFQSYILGKYKSVNSFANEAGIPYTTIVGGIKRGILGMSIQTVIKMCQVLEIDVTKLVEGKIEPVKKNVLLSVEEFNLVNQYRNLDTYGQELITKVSEHEYNRCNSSKIKIAARNGTFEERTITDDEKKKLLDEINQMPDVPE